MRPTRPAVVVASGMRYPATLAFDPHGRLWVATAAAGAGTPAAIWYVPRGGRPRRIATGVAGPTSLAWIGNRLYVGSVITPGDGEISVLQGFTGTGFTSRRVLLRNLPIGIHEIGTFVQGPDGRIFTGYGALGDHSGPGGRILSLSPSGGAPMTEATGLRTAYGLAFWGRRLLVTVNGPDQAIASPDRVVAFKPGGKAVNFGFPKCYGQGGAACAGFKAAFASLPSHSSPEGLVVKGDVAYVADYGSAVVGKPAPSEIVRIDLRTRRQSVFWRAPHQNDLVGLALGPDGNLYATLLATGQVVRLDL